MSGENYSEFFHIDSFKPSATVADPDDTVINLRLYWMASQYAHILLSSNNHIDTSARVYEIGIVQTLVNFQSFANNFGMLL